MKWIQTKALFVDAYRDLNARKLFWVVLILNVLGVAGFAALGVKGDQLSILGWELPERLPDALYMYKTIFSSVVVKFGLTFVCTILALVSTASIFPDFQASGAIDLYLSRPIGRWRLFLTKYATGLLFVLLQVTVFTVGAFVVLGWRAGVWELGLFWAIPIVVVFFSYLFSICTLFGVLTRSTLAALSLTILAWLLIAGLTAAERNISTFVGVYEQMAGGAERRLKVIDRRIGEAEQRIAEQKKEATTEPVGGESEDERDLRRLRREREEWARLADKNSVPQWLRWVQPTVFAVNTVVPKTTETIGLLDRVLFKDSEITAMLQTTEEEGGRHSAHREMELAKEHYLRSRSLWWVVGSSLVFEVGMLGLAGWVFKRRDY